MAIDTQALATQLFSELLAVDHLARGAVARILPRGMELSHFLVLNHLAQASGERTPAQLARTFHLTRGAMTNTLSKLEAAGWVHVRPDWDDARRKLVAISPAGRSARDSALAAIAPLVSDVVRDVGEERVRTTLPVLRAVRGKLTPGN